MLFNTTETINQFKNEALAKLKKAKEMKANKERAELALEISDLKELTDLLPAFIEDNKKRNEGEKSYKVLNMFRDRAVKMAEKTGECKFYCSPLSFVIYQGCTWLNNSDDDKFKINCDFENLIINIQCNFIKFSNAEIINYNNRLGLNIPLNKAKD